MKSLPRSCRVASACAVALPFEVATSFPGLRPPRLDMNGDDRLKREKGKGGRGKGRLGHNMVSKQRTNNKTNKQASKQTAMQPGKKTCTTLSENRMIVLPIVFIVIIKRSIVFYVQGGAHALVFIVHTR